MSNRQQSSLLTRFAKGTSSLSFGLSPDRFSKFSDTRQLVINTGTTIITFLMVFLIQNTHNRDSAAVRLKLDELICAVKKARNEFIDVEDLDDRELAEKRKEMLEQVEETKDKIEKIDDAAEDRKN